jgi:ATPase subunit of ABC transporter with duplicated ATPase domains
MVIVSHDRHFLNTVCTHMADLDYGELRVFPGNYDEYMTAATLAREQLLADNAKKRAQIADLQEFVSRFSANASKSRQATSRKRQIEKIELAEVKPSSRVSPYIRFEQDKKLYRLAVSLDKLAKSYGEHKVFRDVTLHVEAGERVAVVGTNGIGKTTLLRSIMGELPVDRGTVKWAENAEVAYMPQDHAAAFAEPVTVFDWMRARGKPRDDDQAIRATLGRLLFSRDEMLKTVDKLSGGERGRMLFGEVMLKRPNIILMDEPTNHLDMESIEALNLALENYPGTLIFVSHDREFVSSIATRIVEIKATGVIDFRGTYDDYLRSRGIAIDLQRAASQ